MKIKFLATNKINAAVREKPVPASSMMPRWWKDMPVYTNEEKKLNLCPFANVTAKKCFPLIDGISAGYIIPLWADLMVTQTNEGPYIRWTAQDDVVEHWSSKQVSNYEVPQEYDNSVFKYFHGWIIKTPPNYSCLITHPIGYNNLPFKTLTGIVDTDKLETMANSPFIIKKNFEGVIEKGTPMLQIIPFKRDNWESEIDFIKDDEYAINLGKIRTKFMSYYASYIRSNKKFQ